MHNIVKIILAAACMVGLVTGRGRRLSEAVGIAAVEDDAQTQSYYKPNPKPVPHHGFIPTYQTPHKKHKKVAAPVSDCCLHPSLKHPVFNSQLFVPPEKCPVNKTAEATCEAATLLYAIPGTMFYPMYSALI
eukprot:Selendium_serpulae@DN6104_c0_g1_i2.p1